VLLYPSLRVEMGETAGPERAHLNKTVWACQFGPGGGEPPPASPLTPGGENPRRKFTFEILSGGD